MRIGGFDVPVHLPYVYLEIQVLRTLTNKLTPEGSRSIRIEFVLQPACSANVNNLLSVL